MPNLVAVFAHPDDESLGAGGLLARNAAAGEPTSVVTATWATGTHRAAELVDVPLDEAVGRLVEHLRELRPDVVVTHDHHGNLTGHPDHVRTHRLAVLAAEECGVEVHLATHPHSALPMLREVERGALPGLVAGRPSSTDTALSDTALSDNLG